MDIEETADSNRRDSAALVAARISDCVRGFRRGTAHIWTIPAEGGTPATVTTDRDVDWSPAWAPNGERLYYASDRGGRMNLWSVPIDERSGRVLGSPSPYDSLAS